MPGIEILSANVEMQKQNPVERHIQTFDNLDSAVLVNQDLLPASFRGLSALDVAKTDYECHLQYSVAYVHTEYRF